MSHKTYSAFLEQYNMHLRHIGEGWEFANEDMEKFLFENEYYYQKYLDNNAFKPSNNLKNNSMAYNNNRQGGYNNGGGYNNRSNNGYANRGQGGQAKKHSGAGHRVYNPVSGPNKGNTQYLTYGWKLNRSRELIQVKCVTTSKSVLKETGWMGSVACTFTNTVTGEQQFHWGTMQKSTGKVVIDACSMVVNPKAKNGGYCGTYVRSKN